MLDTCAVIDMLVANEDLDKSVKAVIDDPEYTLCASFETTRDFGIIATKDWNS
jgi:PIN domain nuclease of toxin-antitoxin system